MALSDDPRHAQSMIMIAHWLLTDYLWEFQSKIAKQEGPKHHIATAYKASSSDHFGASYNTIRTKGIHYDLTHFLLFLPKTRISHLPSFVAKR